MKRYLPVLFFAILVTVSAVYPRLNPPKNPDPNHTHADFAVWINGKELDFSAVQYMTTKAEEAALPTGSMKLYLHLHDGNAHVMHRHKPGLSIGDFFTSLGLTMTNQCLTLDDIQYGLLDAGWKSSYAITKSVCTNGKFHWTMVVNGKAVPMQAGYVFHDGDKILLTYGAGDDWSAQWKQMTDDACRYSKTCPWKGPAPTESCISDPTVPCRIK